MTLFQQLYSLGGHFLRSFLPSRFVHGLRKVIPRPDGIPHALAEYVPLVPWDTLQSALQEGPSGAPDLFILSVINWDYRYQRPQQFATRLAQVHRVFYIEMDLADRDVAVRRIRPNLYIVRMPRPGIGHIVPYRGRASSRQVAAWQRHFLEVCQRVGTGGSHLLVVEHPFWWQFVKSIASHQKLVVDSMDDLSGFSNTGNFALIQEREMIAAADAVIVSSQALADKWRPLSRPVLIRNGVEEGRIGKGLSSREDGSGTTRVGYVGAIAEWFDVSLLSEAAALDLRVEYHICGGITNKNALALADLPNVTLYGEIPYQEVSTFLSNMDVACIPFILLPVVVACDPVKFYEYCAAGIPTISTRLPELKHASSLVLFADDAPSFVSQIYAARSLKRDPQFKFRLLDFARSNTWAVRTALLEAILAELSSSIQDSRI